MSGTASQAKKVIGTKLEVFDNTGANPLAVVDVVGFDTNRTRETVDTTHMDSPNGYREFQVSLKNGGTCTIECHYVAGDPVHAQFSDDFESGFLRKYRITLTAEAGSEQENFNAYVTGVSKPYKLDDVYRINVTLNISGPFS